MQYSRKGILRNPQILPLIIVTVISTVMIILPLDIRTTISRIGTLSLLYPFSELDKYLSRIDRTFENNREISQRLDSLTVLVSRMTEYKSENERLRSMLDFERHHTLRMVPAEIVSATFGYPYKSMLISAGVSNGVGSNMPVITPNGVVGKTIAASSNGATVQLLYDPSCRVAAKVQASGAQGIIIYNGGNYLTMRDVPLEESVLAGDSIVTSGLGGIFPEGLFIGTVVKSVENEGGLFHDVHIIPGVDFDAIDEVFVITSTYVR
jgi:rod shape-determining protein MreC